MIIDNDAKSHFNYLVLLMTMFIIKIVEILMTNVAIRNLSQKQRELTVELFVRLKNQSQQNK